MPIFQMKDKSKNLPHPRSWQQSCCFLRVTPALVTRANPRPCHGASEAMEQRYLRWNGWLVRYALGGSQDPAAPTALLVHGFGASSDQWDRVFEEYSPSKSKSSAPSLSTDPPAKAGAADAADAAAASGPAPGVRLLALDLLGFGHSAKPPLSFSQYSWADCARDVALRVGGGPFFIAGNSIGG